MPGFLLDYLSDVADRVVAELDRHGLVIICGDHHSGKTSLLRLIYRHYKRHCDLLVASAAPAFLRDRFYRDLEFELRSLDDSWLLLFDEVNCAHGLQLVREGHRRNNRIVATSHHALLWPASVRKEAPLISLQLDLTARAQLYDRYRHHLELSGEAVSCLVRRALLQKGESVGAFFYILQRVAELAKPDVDQVETLQATLGIEAAASLTAKQGGSVHYFLSRSSGQIRRRVYLEGGE